MGNELRRSFGQIQTIVSTRVAAFRQYVRAKSTTPSEEGLLAAKMVGRWPKWLS